MPESGDLVGPYRLVSQLGKGAMGEVWRARDERLDRYVALKVIPADLAGDVERRARMLREARAAAAIRHHNVVTLFDVVSHQGDDILVMELVEGRTLSETLRKDGPPTFEVALRWIEVWPMRWWPRTRAGSSTATSRPRTSWSRLRA
ncbi:MAG: protein kinase [Myxococcales bacterium]|nr:protein kinase [Myxococcales bacterium]